MKGWGGAVRSREGECTREGEGKREREREWENSAACLIRLLSQHPFCETSRAYQAYSRRKGRKKKSIEEGGYRGK